MYCRCICVDVPYRRCEASSRGQTKQQADYCKTPWDIKSGLPLADPARWRLHLLIGQLVSPHWRAQGGHTQAAVDDPRARRSARVRLSFDCPSFSTFFPSPTPTSTPTPTPTPSPPPSIPDYQHLSTIDSARSMRVGPSRVLYPRGRDDEPGSRGLDLSPSLLSILPPSTRRQHAFADCDESPRPWSLRDRKKRMLPLSLCLGSRAPSTRPSTRQMPHLLLEGQSFISASQRPGPAKLDGEWHIPSTLLQLLHPQGCDSSARSASNKRPRANRITAPYTPAPTASFPGHSPCRSSIPAELQRPHRLL